MRDLPGTSRHGITPYDLRWPDTPEFTRVAAAYASEAIDRMLDVAWRGYELFTNDFLSHINIQQADAELERSITQSLEPCIRDCLSGDEPYDVQHGPYEYATRSPAPAQSPQYDIAFYLKTNQRVMWPLEAKVIRCPAMVALYVAEINNNYISGRYAPFSSSAAMIGYLLSGEPSEVRTNIEQRLGAKLHPHPKFYHERNHHISNHTRHLTDPSRASGAFQCHHLIMAMTVGPTKHD